MQKDNVSVLDDLDSDGAVAETTDAIKTVLVPKVQNMDDYLIRHYKSYIIQELNKRLVNGEITEIIGMPVKSERIVPGECCFRRFNYWRLNQCDFLIDLDLRLELRVETPAGLDTDFFSFCVELWFSFCADDDEECTFDRIGLLEEMPDHEGAVKLDKYLVPILRRDEIDQYAEDIWANHYPEAVNNPKLRRPRDLAERLHLSVVTVPLYKQGNTRSIVFFHDAGVMVLDNSEPGEHKDSYHEEPIKANTIVLNSRTDGSYSYDLDIYHECIHYEWHYLFYRLQDMHNNDVKQLRMVRRSAVKDKDPANPVQFMEFQACYGSYALMMPKAFMLETIENLYKDAYAGNLHHLRSDRGISRNDHVQNNGFDRSPREYGRRPDLRR